MVDPVSIGISVAAGALVKNAPSWFSALQETFFSKGKDLAYDKGKEKVKGLLDERKCQRHIELALKNAVERGLLQWHDANDRKHYRDIITFLSELHSDTLRQEALRLFSLSDAPDLAILNEKYNQARCRTDAAHNQEHIEIDATPYLRSFFEALIAELYNDPLFRDKMSTILATRADMQQQRSLDEIIAILKSMLADEYSSEAFERDLETYINYIEAKFSQHQFKGVVLRGDEVKAPSLDNIFVPLNISLRQSQQAINSSDSPLLPILEKYSYFVLLGKPGSGKSTTTSYLAWSHAHANQPLSNTDQHYEYEILPGKPIPLHIELRLFSQARKKKLECSFLSYLTDIVLKQKDKNIPIQFFQTLLERHAMLVLFDGLDEVSTLAERQQLVQEIEDFAQDYPGNRILITSRPVGYDLAPFADPLFVHGELQDLNNEQIHQFLERWYSHVLKYTPLPLEIKQELDSFYETITTNERLHKLAVNHCCSLS